MSALPKSSRQAIAGFVTIAGVVAIWAFNTHRQAGSTEEIARVWVGGQWDVTRTCIVGTPFRDDDAAGIERKLASRLLGALVEIGEAEEAPPPSERWPARCVPMLSSLRVAPEAVNGDPDAALGALSVLLPQVLTEGGDEVDRVRAADRAVLARIAAQVALLDEIMPSGDEYELADYADAETPHALAILESLDCPVAAPPRPAFVASLLPTQPEVMDFRREGQRDRRVERTADGAGFELVSTSVGPPSLLGPFTTDRREPLALPPLRALRFLDLDRLLLLREADLAIFDLETRSIRPIAAPGMASGADRLAACLGGERAFLVTVRGGEATAGTLSLADDAPEVTVLGAVQASMGAVVACDAEGLVVFDPLRGHGSLCDLHACVDVPARERASELDVRVAGGELLLRARAPHSNVLVGRWLSRAGAPTWDEPFALPRGEMRTDTSPPVIHTCHDRDVPLEVP